MKSALNRLKWGVCHLSGDDLAIIRRCSAKTQARFTAIGVLVLLVFFLCFFGIYLSLDGLFGIDIVVIPLAVFFAGMITIIYLLLLYTLSRNVLPVNLSRSQRFFTVGLRMLFLCFIALIISKPIEGLLFKERLASMVSIQKAEDIRSFSEKVLQYVNEEIEVLEALRETALQNNQAEVVARYDVLIGEKQSEGMDSILQLKNEVRHSRYFIYGMKAMFLHVRESWAFSLFVVTLFVLPALLKILMSKSSDYYQEKKRIELSLILDEYGQFKERYKQILLDQHGKDVSFSEPFVDAPFNTIRRGEVLEYESEEQFLKELYGD